MCTGIHPWNVGNPHAMIQQIINCQYKVPNTIGYNLRDLISKMIVHSPKQRISIAQALEHTFIRSSVGSRLEHAVIKSSGTNERVIRSKELTIAEISKISKTKSVITHSGIFSPFEKKEPEIHPPISIRTSNFDNVVQSRRFSQSNMESLHNQPHQFESPRVNVPPNLSVRTPTPKAFKLTLSSSKLSSTDNFRLPSAKPIQKQFRLSHKSLNNTNL